MHILWEIAGRRTRTEVRCRASGLVGRIATDLRVSVTDRCNLRCSYRMPAEGLEWLPGPGLLTDGEVSRLIEVPVLGLGVTDVNMVGMLSEHVYVNMSCWTEESHDGTAYGSGAPKRPGVGVRHR
jgi:hypothetical protein